VGQGADVVGLRQRLPGGGAGGFHRFGQGALGGFAEQRGVLDGGDRTLRLLQDVADALVGRGQRGGFRQLREDADGIDAAVEVVQRGRFQFGDGVEVRAGHALVGVVAAQAVEDERVELARIRLDRLRCKRCIRVGKQCLEVEVKTTLDDRPRQPQRIAPQRERVLVAGLRGSVSPAKRGL